VRLPPILISQFINNFELCESHNGTSAGTAGRPGLPRRIFHVQNRPKPLRCQPITVGGFVMKALGCQSSQTADNQAHRNRSAGPLHRPLQNTELLTKGQNLKLERRTLAKES
jgi:hypothetical protein